MKSVPTSENQNKALIFNPYFGIGLVALIINDAFLKWTYNNTFTGKLSDFAGLFISPMFLAFLFPRVRKASCFLIGLLFLYWKSSLSTPLINMLNSNLIIEFNRVIDYGDYVALCILPFSHYLINRYEDNQTKRQISPFLLNMTLGVVFTTFTATTVVRYQVPEGNVMIDKRYSIKLQKDTILNRINQMGYQWQYHDFDTLTSASNYYEVNDFLIKIGSSVDTINNIKFRLFETGSNKSEIHLINVTLKNPGNIQSWRYLKSLSRNYRHLVKEHLVNEIKK